LVKGKKDIIRYLSRLQKLPSEPTRCNLC